VHPHHQNLLLKTQPKQVLGYLPLAPRSSIQQLLELRPWLIFRPSSESWNNDRIADVNRDEGRKGNDYISTCVGCGHYLVEASGAEDSALDGVDALTAVLKSFSV
jgi:hypothetical protein